MSNTCPVSPFDKAEPAAPAASSGAAPRRGRILIVDDEPEVAALLGEIVAAMGYEAVLAHSGNQAKQCLAADGAGISAILSDLRMPDGDGPHLYDWLLAHRPALAKRIGFITGDGLGTSAGRFLARSGRPLLEKPFVPAEIREFLADLTG